MAVRKLSVSLEEEAVAAATTAAQAEGVSLSAWLSKVAIQAARREDGLRAMEEWQEEHGAFTPAERRWAADVWDRIERGEDVTLPGEEDYPAVIATFERQGDERTGIPTGPDPEDRR